MLLFQSRLCAFPSSSDPKSRGCSQDVAQPHGEDHLIQSGFFAMGVGWGEFKFLSGVAGFLPN